MTTNAVISEEGPGKETISPSLAMIAWIRDTRDLQKLEFLHQKLTRAVCQLSANQVNPGSALTHCVR